MDKLHLDEEFEALIPPITPEEYEKLEQSLLSEGCRDKLVVWEKNQTLLDGYNRFEICRKHEIPFGTITKTFETREEAKLWVIGNQLGRRNLDPFQRASLALKLKDIIAGKAKEKERTHTDQGYLKSENPPIHTNKKLAEIAQVSTDTINKVKVIEEEGTPEQKEQVRNRKKSINQAHKEIRARKTKPKEKPKENKPKPEGRMSEEFQAALRELALVILKEQENEWRDTDKAVAIKTVKALRGLILSYDNV